MYKVSFLALLGVTISGLSIILFLKYLKKKNCLKPKTIFVINNNFQWNSCFEIIKKELEVFPVIGFDCEWKNIKGKPCPISLLQIATYSGNCFLIRLNFLSKEIPCKLLDILANKKIIKVGIGCVEDANKLFRDHGIYCLGCVDLRNYMLRNNINISNGGGLKSITKNILNVELDKSIFLRCSDWEALELTESQIYYAACDALAAILIFSSIFKKKRKFDDHLPHQILPIFQGILDLKYKGKNDQKNDFLNKTSSDNRISEEIKASRAYSIRKKPLYENCKIFAADGQMLSTCDSKKANWYLEKGLAEFISEDPLSVRLLFEPAGRPEDDDNYYAQEKNNICVVCGKNDSYIRKNIVPHEYRKHFPSIMKEHKSHDVVLLCTACHMRSNHLDNTVKQQLAFECNIPQNQPLYGEDSNLMKIKSAAKALVNRSYRIPDDRKTELQSLVCQYFGVNTLTTELLIKATQIETKKLNNDYIDHGEAVVKHYMESQGLATFERMWRQHFLDQMRPKYMPLLWSIDHGHKLLEEQLH